MRASTLLGSTDAVRARIHAMGLPRTLTVAVTCPVSSMVAFMSRVHVLSILCILMLALSWSASSSGAL